MDRSSRIAFYESRVGHASAVTRVNLVRLQIQLFWMMSLTITLMFLYLGFHSRWFYIAWWLSFIALVMNVLYRLILRHRCKREASEFLGVRLGPFSDVPMSDAQYPIWCAKHGIAPWNPPIDAPPEER
jgi:hypothetical protein